MQPAWSLEILLKFDIALNSSAELHVLGFKGM